MASSNSSSGGISTLGLLGIVFVTLKLCKVIDWSWWYVTMPFWIVIPFLIFLLIIWIIVKITENKIHKKINTFKPTPRKSKFQQRLDDYMEQKKSNDNS